MTKFPLAVLGGALAAAALSLSIPALGHADSGPAAGGSSSAATPSRNTGPSPVKRSGTHRSAVRSHSGAAVPNSAASTAGVWAPAPSDPAPSDPVANDPQLAAIINAIRTGQINSTRPVPGLDDGLFDPAPSDDLVPNDGLSEAAIAELLGITAGSQIGQ